MGHGFHSKLSNCWRVSHEYPIKSMFLCASWPSPHVPFLDVKISSWTLHGCVDPWTGFLPGYIGDQTKSIRFLEVPILYVNIKGFMIYDEQSCYDNKGTVHDIQVPNNIWLLAKPPAKKTPRVLSECLCCGPCRRRCRCFCSKKEQVAPEGGRCWGGTKQKVEGDLGETKFQPTQIGSQPRKMENRSTVTGNDCLS